MKTRPCVFHRKSPTDLEDPTVTDEQKQDQPKQRDTDATAALSIHTGQEKDQHTTTITNMPRPEPVCKAWTHMTENVIHKNIRAFNVSMATKAATYPKRCLVLITLFSFGVVITGFLTNFTLIFGHSEIFTPIGSRPRQHAHWIEHDSNFHVTEDFVFLIHSDGENVLNKEAVRRLFYALDTVFGTTGYDQMCSQSEYLDLENNPACWIWSATNFWTHNITQFELEVKSDDDVARILSGDSFPDGTPVFKEALYGKYESVNETLVYNEAANQIFEYQHENDYLVYVPNFFVSIGMPYVDDTWTYQERLLEVFTDMRLKWQQQSPEENPNNVQIDFFCGYAYELEYARALYRDFPLVPIVFFVMLGFTCFIFHRYGRMQVGAPTRATIGMASVVTVGMSMMSGFGVMFCFGVPFTNITLMAPFIILGVGLDDTFIITGAYFRRLKEEIEEQERKGKGQKSRRSSSCPSSKELPQDEDDSIDGSDPVENTSSGSVSALEQLYDHSVIVERVRSTLDEVGMSISLTTITTTTAFILGCLSTIPGIRWLCLYSSVTIVFDTFYQITYFIALLTLDERRVVMAQAKAMVRQDVNPPEPRVSLCSKFHSWACDAYAGLFPKDASSDEDSTDDSADEVESSPIFIERLMAWYARTLMKPRVRNAVIAFCLVLFGVCVYSTTQLRQKFSPRDYVPKDSYIQGFFESLYEYSSLVLTFEVFFRNVDQSDPVMREQMRDYISELAKLPEIGKEPDACWVLDMEPYLQGDFSGLDFEELNDEHVARAEFLAGVLTNGNFTFEETMGIVLDIPEIRDIYGEDIVRNDAGEITASKCYLHVRHINLQDVPGQVDFLREQQHIARSQPVNQLPDNQNNWAFFSFSSFQGYWELYAVAVEELVATTVFGVLAVCAVGFVVIPHWTAVCFVGPLIIMLYFDLLGVMQFCGIHINALTYVTIVISIGLLVDFLMHILLRYYEAPGATREAKVQYTLETMGASMMLGGFTTWLGVIPMALSTTIVFTTIFIAFLAMVSLGLLIGLAFLPAILSICGPVVCVSAQDLGKDDDPSGLSPQTESFDTPTSFSSGATNLTGKLPSPYQPISAKNKITGTDIPQSPSGVSSDLQEAQSHDVSVEASPSWASDAVHEAPNHVAPMQDEDEDKA